MYRHLLAFFLLLSNQHDHSDNTLDNCKSDITAITDKTKMERWHTFSANFNQAWSNAQQSVTEPVHSYMDKQHSFALYMYANTVLPPANQDFKSEEKTGDQKKRSESCSAFSTLSEALQILKHSQVTCLSTNYSTETLLPLNISNKQVRFSTFVLGSEELNSTRNSSCFHIYSCFGADITQYSVLKLNQVLIPPYEAFKVTGVQTDTDGCKVLYRLRSNQDCVYDKESNVLHPISVSPPEKFWVFFAVSLFLIVSVVLMCITAKMYFNSTVNSPLNLHSSAEIPTLWPVLG